MLRYYILDLSPSSLSIVIVTQGNLIWWNLDTDLASATGIQLLQSYKSFVPHDTSHSDAGTIKIVRQSSSNLHFTLQLGEHIN
jgi:hypothetical protein